MDWRRLSIWTAVSLAGLLLLFVVLQGRYLNIPFERDEGNYAYGAWIMTKGLVPYLNTFEQKPPLIYLPYFLALLIDPRAYWPVHLLAALSLLATVGLVGLVGYREFGRRAGLLAMWLLVPLSLLPQLTPFAANTEKFMVLPFAGLLAIYAFNREKPGGQAWFWAGVCGMATLLFKQIAVFGVGYVFAAWLYGTWRRDRRVNEIFPALLGALLTFVLVCGYFIARAGWAALWEQTVVYNRYYAATFGGLSLNNFLHNMQMFSLVWPVLLLLLAWGLFRGGRRVLFYLGLLALTVGSIFPTPYGHYYMMVLPAAALFLAGSAASLMKQANGRQYWSLAALIVILIVWPVKDWYLLKPAEVLTRSYSQLNPFVEAPLAAEKVAALTAPDDYVYVAGTEPEILFYAKRLCPAKMTGVYALVMNNPLALAYQQETIAELEKRRPRVIVWVRSPLSWLAGPASPPLIFNYFDEILRDRYRLAGGTIRRGAEAYWRDTLRPEDLGSCSMKVYQLRPEYAK